MPIIVIRTVIKLIMITVTVIITGILITITVAVIILLAIVIHIARAQNRKSSSPAIWTQAAEPKGLNLDTDPDTVTPWPRRPIP